MIGTHGIVRGCRVEADHPDDAEHEADINWFDTSSVNMDVNNIFTLRRICDYVSRASSGDMMSYYIRLIYP